MRTHLLSVYVLGALILTLGLGQAITEEADVGSPTRRPSIPQQPAQVATTTYNVELVSMYGGRPFADLAVQGNYAYVRKGSGIIVLDISNPDQVTPLGAIPMPGGWDSFLSAMYAFGDYLYLFMPASGIHIVDVSNPMIPREVGVYRTNVWSLYVLDNLAIGGWGGCPTPTPPPSPPFPPYPWQADCYGGVRVIDVSDPSRPAIIGELNYEHPTEVLYATREYAYVTADGKLRVIDISDPRTPVEVGSHDVPRVDRSFFAGSRAYLAGPDGLRIFDISQPAAPAEIGRYDEPITGDIFASGSYTYVGIPVEEDGKWATGHIRVLDVADPTAPVEVGAYSIAEWPGTFVGSAERLYVLSKDILRVLDISNPALPVESGTYFNPIWDRTCCPGGPSGLRVDDHRAYVLADYIDYRPYPQGAPVVTRTLRVIDVSDPRQPVELATYDQPTASLPLRDFSVSGNHAFVLEDDSNLRIIDVSDPTAPEEISTIQVSALNLHVAGQYAYVTGDGAMRIIDVSDPAAPVVVGSYLTAGWVGDVYAAGNYAYLTDTLQGYIGPDGQHAAFRVIDVSDPSAPVEVGAFGLPAYPDEIYVANNYAYVLAGGRLDPQEARGIWIADVSNPTSPAVAGFYESRDARDFVVADQFMFLVEWSGGSSDTYRLSVLDISTPTRPIAVGTFDIPTPSDISATDNCIYLAAQELVTFHLVPSAPGTAGFTALSGTPYTSFLPLIMYNDPGPGICG